jgi:hypothetical protein
MFFFTVCHDQVQLIDKTTIMVDEVIDEMNDEIVDDNDEKLD